MSIMYRQALREDMPAVSEFLKRFFEPDSSIRSHELEYYDWKCYRNPVQTGEVWLAYDGSALVGVKSITPKRIKALDVVVAGGETGDTFVHPDYQRKGILTTMFQRAREHGLEGRLNLIYGTPGRNSLPVYEVKLNYGQAPVRLHALTKLLYPRQVLASRLPSFIANVASPVARIVSEAMFQTGIRGIGRSDVLVSQESSFPDDIGLLYETVAGNYDVMVVRDKAYLEWRYINNPDNYSILIARNRDGAVLGYMVTKIAVSGNISTGFICDFLTIESDFSIFKHLLAFAVVDFSRRKAGTIVTWAVEKSQYDRIFLRLGFLPRAKLPLICYKNKSGNQALETRKWYFTLGDSDNI